VAQSDDTVDSPQHVLLMQCADQADISKGWAGRPVVGWREWTALWRAVWPGLSVGTGLSRWHWNHYCHGDPKELFDLCFH